MSFTFYWILLALLVFGSASCSFAEALLMGRSAEMVHNLSKNGSKHDLLLERLMNHKDTLLAVVLLGNNICNSMAASVGAFIAVHSFKGANLPEGAVLLINTLVITSIIFLFGEVLPKSAALKREYKVGYSIMLFVIFLNKLLYPVVAVTDWIVRRILRVPTSSPTKDNISTQKELKMTVEAKHLEGKIFTHYRDMLNGLLNLEEVEVSSVMRHKSDVVCINLNSPTLEDTIDGLLSSGYSRFPVYQDSSDNVVGVLHIRDLFEFYHKNKAAKLVTDELSKMMKKPIFVTENTSLYQQMLMFRNTRNHMAIVVDEFGVFAGVITLEDIVEEIIGEIGDEHDKDEGPGVIIQNDKIIVEGDYPAHDFSRRFDIDLNGNDAKTMAGLIIDKLERLPNIGETLELFGYVVVVKAMKQNKITSIEMRKKMPTD